MVNNDKSVKVEYFYKNNVQKRIYQYDIEYTSEGKYRRNFKNGKYIEYDKDPSVVSYKNATYTELYTAIKSEALAKGITDTYELPGVRTEDER